MRRSRGYAYVNFVPIPGTDPGEALGCGVRCPTSLVSISVKFRGCRGKQRRRHGLPPDPHQNRQVHLKSGVGNKGLPKEVDSRTLHGAFEVPWPRRSSLGQEYRPFASYPLMCSLSRGRTEERLWIVDFKEPRSAARVIESTNGRTIDGVVMFVAGAQTTSDSHKMLRERFENIQSDTQQKIHGKNLYVKNIEPSIDDESFKAILESSHFGEITSSRNHPTILFTCISSMTPDNSDGKGQIPLMSSGPGALAVYPMPQLL
ncbi:hypothetical protein BSKO_00205 [Bryopsis sp. KO-2023]|nr:hypothetical protein BSKO_00205 [Bryopsis sp. KO-2023]